MESSLKRNVISQLELSTYVCITYVDSSIEVSAVSSFADRKKIRETNPNEEKFSEPGGEESPLQPPGMNPVINSTSSPNMALISNALAAYTYISGKATVIKSCVGCYIMGSDLNLQVLYPITSRESDINYIEIREWGFMCATCVWHVIFWGNIPHFLFPETERWVNVGQRNADVMQR